MIDRTQIISITERLLEGSDLFLVEAVVKPGNKITVYVDGDHGVTIDACHHLCRQLEGTLDRDKEDFDLTVSSAGVDRPLLLPRQFKKNTGRTIEILTNEELHFTGKLIRCDEEGVELEIAPDKRGKNTATEKKTVLYKDIKRAKEVITFKK